MTTTTTKQPYGYMLIQSLNQELTARQFKHYHEAKAYMKKNYISLVNDYEGECEKYFVQNECLVEARNDIYFAKIVEIA